MTNHPALRRTRSAGDIGRDIDKDHIMRIIQISDTHISQLGGTTNENAEKAIELVSELEPDLVVHTGDVTILDPDEDDDRVAAKAILSRIEAPLRVLPGNHDIGEPGADPFGGKSVTSERVAAFRAHFGEDRFVDEVGEWTVVGFNSELFGSGLPEEEDQWAWLESLPERLGGRPTLIFSHKPVWAHAPEYQTPKVSLDAAVLPRLEAILSRIDARGFGSGHLHHYALTAAPSRPSAVAVSAPPTAFVHRSAEMARVTGPGMNQLGVVSYEIEGDRVLPFFRSRIDFEEKEFGEVDSAMRALGAMGIELPAG
ncbi:metallophosphoesterase [Leucobacter sp. CSA1]|uniref:Metallophosphoesterase n=1 Tax=Leucobacter chromiisoli TaxID=2796471 RepID=A0A934QA72_9MICO|nr:metallophosphoesterase [Leucobacter chromiisoli]MBK0419454.1 metallophosphoesterase [Leucobacter chromiisoli]